MICLKYYKFFFLFLAISIANCSYAQKYNWDEAAKQERQRSNDAYIDARRKNSPSTGYSSNVKIPTPQETAASKKAAADYKAWRQQVDYDAANRQMQREQDQRNYYAKIESDKIAAKERFISDYIET